MQLKVKHHNPWKTRVFILLGLLALGVGGWSLFDYGRYQAGYDSAEYDLEQLRLVALVDELQDEIEKLREQKAQLERAAQIERQAYNELDTNLKLLQGEILELKEELAFYRGIVSPRDASRGLRLQRFSLEPNGLRSYRYTVVLTQVLKNDSLASGRVKFLIDGLQGNESKTLDLAALSENSVKELDYRFKYFQNLEGDLVLPKGFKPMRATAQILPGGRQEDMIEKTIDWPTEETQKDVEQ
ncbi:MAG: DUF6776 family protein [Gammaproteobacteria bacterium]